MLSDSEITLEFGKIVFNYLVVGRTWSSDAHRHMISIKALDTPHLGWRNVPETSKMWPFTRVREPFWIKRSSHAPLSTCESMFSMQASSWIQLIRQPPMDPCSKLNTWVDAKALSLWWFRHADCQLHTSGTEHFTADQSRDTFLPVWPSRAGKDSAGEEAAW